MRFGDYVFRLVSSIISKREPFPLKQLIGNLNSKFFLALVSFYLIVTVVSNLTPFVIFNL